MVRKIVCLTKEKVNPSSLYSQNLINCYASKTFVYINKGSPFVGFITYYIAFHTASDSFSY